MSPRWNRSCSVCSSDSSVSGSSSTRSPAAAASSSEVVVSIAPGGLDRAERGLQPTDMQPLPQNTPRSPAAAAPPGSGCSLGARKGTRTHRGRPAWLEAPAEPGAGQDVARGQDLGCSLTPHAQLPLAPWGRGTHAPNLGPSRRTQWGWGLGGAGPLLWGKRGPSQEIRTPGSCPWGRTNSASASSLLPGRGKAARGGDRPGWGEQHPRAPTRDRAASP